MSLKHLKKRIVNLMKLLRRRKRVKESQLMPKMNRKKKDQILKKMDQVPVKNQNNKEHQLQNVKEN